MSKRLTQEQCISNFVKEHQDAYDYSKTVYVDWKTPVIIGCKIHGDFKQIPNNHQRGAGCRECGLLKQALSLIEKVKAEKEDFSHMTPPEGSKIIPLTKGKYALVDDEDYDRVMEYNWNICNNYAENNNMGYLHRFIMNPPYDMVVDHIDHDKLNCRKYNLRVCSQQDNLKNSIAKNKYKGVSWCKVKKKWRVSILYKHIGYYKTEEEAAKIYDEKANELYGEFAWLNFKTE